jgi:hypothetical protein
VHRKVCVTFERKPFDSIRSFAVALDYAIQYACDVRAQIPDPQLQTMVRMRGKAEAAIAQITRTQPDLSRAQVLAYELVLGVMGTDGRQYQQPVPLAHVMASVEPLNAVQAKCRSCPANLNVLGTFGCIANVNYPLTAADEEWLVARLPDDAKDPSLQMLFQYINDFQIDGKPVDAQRSRRELYELGKPVERKWGWLGKQKVTSSQVLHLLAYQSQQLDPKLTTLFTQLLKLGADQPAKGVDQMRTFTRAFAVSAQLKAPMFVNA